MMPGQRLLALFPMLFLLSSAAGYAGDCQQQDAIYEDQDKAYELRFSAVESDAAVTSHIFKIATPNSGLVLDGYAMPTDEVMRSAGIVMHNCPEGDATGAELEACTIWEGILYSIDDGGVVANLPVGTAPAAAQILLPDLGRSIRASALWDDGKATVAPWDALKLKGCSR